MVLGLLCPSTVMAGESVAQHATVCAIADAPAQFYGKLVIVDGQLRSNMFEFMSLYDARCPERALGLAITRKARLSDKGTRKLFRALVSGDRDGTFDKTITARFEGTVGREDDEDFPFTVLNVSSVSDLDVRQR